MIWWWVKVKKKRMSSRPLTKVKGGEVITKIYLYLFWKYLDLLLDFSGLTAVRRQRDWCLFRGSGGVCWYEQISRSVQKCSSVTSDGGNGWNGETLTFRTFVALAELQRGGFTVAWSVVALSHRISDLFIFVTLFFFFFLYREPLDSFLFERVPKANEKVNEPKRNACHTVWLLYEWTQLATRVIGWERKWWLMKSEVEFLIS